MKKLNFFLNFIIIIFIVLIFRLFIIKEGFQTSPSLQINQNLLDAYSKFVEFYSTFCSNWTKAITSSFISDIPQQPLSDPTQVTQTTIPTISTEQMNAYIIQLSQQLSQPLPSICTVLPTTLDTTNIEEIIQQIPTDVQPYINALNWMNTQLSKSIGNLEKALQGQTFETFQDCSNVVQCIQKVSTQQLVQQEEQLATLMAQFFTNSELLQAFELNVNLMAQIQQIQNEAQSGEIFKRINIPFKQTTFTLPQGADTLSKLKSSNPQRYTELQTEAGQWFTIKALLEQINQTF